MSFSTEPKSAPNVLQPPGSSARERAIAILEARNQPQVGQPVPNATNVSTEELGALKPNPSASIEGRQDNNVESPSTQPQQEKKSSEEPLSSQYAVLARREKALRARAQEQDRAFKAREEALRVKEAEITSKSSSQFDEDKYIPKERLQTDTIRTLLEAGLTYDQITQAALNQGQGADPATQLAMDQLKAEIKSLKDAQEKSNKAYEDSQKTAYQQALQQIRLEAKQLVKSDPSFETIRATNSVSDVVELIERTYNEDGRLLTVEEAATEIENYLVGEAVKLSKLAKIRKQLSPQSASVPSGQRNPGATKPESTQQLKTLTNSVGTSRKLSAKERAILAFRGELHK